MSLVDVYVRSVLSKMIGENQKSNLSSKEKINCHANLTWKY